MITLQERVHGSPPPASWKLGKLHQIFNVRKGNKNIGMQVTNLLSLSYGRIIPKDINTAEGLLPESFETYKIVDPGNIILRLTDLQNDKRSLRQGLVGQRGIITSAYDALEVGGDHDPRFWAYALLALDLAKYYYSLGGGVRQSIKFTDFPNDWVAFPDTETQKSISDFLDTETGRIDDLLEHKNNLSNLLEDRKQTLIFRYMTYGLDASAPIIPVDLPWLKQKPSGWHLPALKRIVQVKDGTHETPQYVDKGTDTFPLVTSRDFIGDSIVFSDSRHISYKDHCDIYRRSNAQKGDVLMSMIGGNIGKAVIVDTDTEFSIKNVALFKTCHSQVLARYIMLFLGSRLFFEQLRLSGRGGAQGFISLGDIRNLLVPLPPYEDLRAFVDIVENEVDKEKLLQKKTASSILSLREYRAALLTGAVTGQVDINEWAKRGETDRRLDQIAEEMAADSERESAVEARA